MADMEQTVQGKHFTRDRVAGRDHESWGEYRKRTLTKAKRIEGPFSVETREGLSTCRDGYLAIDAHGWPYPIAREEFELIYEAVEVVPLEETLEFQLGRWQARAHLAEAKLASWERAANEAVSE